ncbi:MAG: hypothetical protein ACI3Y5_10615 [Prevotella sp.]
MRRKKRLAYHKPTIRTIKTEGWKLQCASGDSATLGTITRGDDITGETVISGDAKQDSHHNLWSADYDEQSWPTDDAQW